MPMPSVAIVAGSGTTVTVPDMPPAVPSPLSNPCSMQKYHHVPTLVKVCSKV